ncbi:unnamed protein product [Cyprideis torosa]|uniref:Ribosome-recycling factor, mitochondrial n=1 Tax=Cyprideis torosa TaxID=163714 RepID=A0A7R8ZMH7_9CRUS|nr:unnamed protein product [Cyprideis torosa]CAG0884374.1 unnamed protein product [Cyprideis torosa]
MTFRLLLRGLFVPLWRCTGKNSTSGFSLRFHAFAQQTSSLHLSPITLKAKDRGKSGKHKKVTIDESEINEVIDIQVYKISLENAISDLKQSFAKDLALRTSIGSIDSIPVNFEGDSYPLSELAKIGMKSNNVVVINMSSFPQSLPMPWWSSLSSGVETITDNEEVFQVELDVKGFKPEDINVKVRDRVTREHREHLAKNAKTLLNSTKDRIRRTENTFQKDCKKQTNKSADLLFEVSHMVHAIAEEYCKQAEELMLKKQKELLDPKS